MTTAEFAFAIITAVVALYGAIVASFLALREFRREKRNVVVFLEFVYFYERYRLVIVNAGFRPVTITSLAIDIYDPKEKDIIDSAPSNSILSPDEDENKIPVTIKDGEQITLWLTDVLRDMYLASDKKIIASVFDSEGHVFKTDQTRYFNPKFGKYEK